MKTRPVKVTAEYLAMRAPLSIIIPTLEAEATLPAALGSLVEGLEAGILREVIVSDGGSRDGTCEIAEAAGCEVIRGAPGRGGQLRRGAAAAGGEWLLFLHADSRLRPGWCRAVQAHMKGHPESAGWFALRFDTPGFMPRFVAGWANLRARTLGLPWGDQGLLIPRALHDEVGGYRDIPLMEDVEMARALSRRLRLRPLGAICETSARRYRQEGWLARGARNHWLLLRHFCGADPSSLQRSYRPKGPRS